jgi:hypothetical protein
MITNKSKLGQFYTNNYAYILRNMKVPQYVQHIIEPFAGNGDLLCFLEDIKSYTIECYDIQPKKPFIVQRDTLLEPPSYDNKFVLTNPPYLARNKNADKEIYDKFKCNDLYKCFIMNVVNSQCYGGIIIVPLNFICSVRKSDVSLRVQFMNKYKMTMLNIFEERVFEDTAYAVCSMQFERRTDTDGIVTCNVLPSNQIMMLSLTEQNNYTVGGEIRALPKSTKYTVERATRLTKNRDCITNIILKCIDDSIHNKLQLKIDDNSYTFIDNTLKLSSRSYATLVITPMLGLHRQLDLVRLFNAFLENYRAKYNSLFLTNYRESNTIARKRISFDLAFHICSYLLSIMD